MCDHSLKMDDDDVKNAIEIYHTSKKTAKYFCDYIFYYTFEYV